jgi:hypothetical protein
LDQTNKRSFIVTAFSPERFLDSVFPTSEKFDSDLELDAKMHKTDAHPSPPMNSNITPMPTQNLWAWVWVWAPNVDLCCIVITQLLLLTLFNVVIVLWNFLDVCATIGGMNERMDSNVKTKRVFLPSIGCNKNNCIPKFCDSCYQNKRIILTHKLT